MTRRFTIELLPVIGPEKDIPAPDMATNEQTMAWMMDTYSMQIGYAVPEIVTGKPIAIGGSVFRSEATGAGVVMVIERACQRLGWKLAEQGCVVQGFGNVGGIAARELAARGAKLLAVSDISGGVYSPDGLDYEHMTALGRRARLARRYPGRRARVELRAARAAVRHPRPRRARGAADAENAPRVQCKLVAEGANGPTTIEADEILAERGIPVLPDVLTNAGGVTVSYFEWVQDLGRLFWNRDEIRCEARRQAERRLRPRLGPRPPAAALAAQRGAGRRDPRGRGALEPRGIYP